MKWISTTAKSVPEAMDLALDNLGGVEAEAEIVVVEEPKQGFFGRAKGVARVEARVKPKTVRNKNERRRRNNNKSNNRNGGGAQIEPQCAASQATELANVAKSRNTDHDGRKHQWDDDHLDQTHKELTEK